MFIDKPLLTRIEMIKIQILAISVATFSSLTFGNTTDFLQATSLSWVQEGPMLNDMPMQPNASSSDERITLSNTNKNGWYATPYAGLNLLSDFNDNKLSIEYDTGFSYGVSVGKEIEPGFFLQLDIGEIKNDLKKLTVQIGGGIDVETTDASIRQTPIIMNAIWAPKGHGRLFPYLGLGAGTIRGDYNVDAMPGAFADLLDIDWAFAFQAMVGFKYELSPSSTVSVSYQYLHAAYDNDLDLNNNLITFGFQFRF